MFQVLDFQYPGLFGDIIAFLKPVMDVWGLFFRALGPSECFGLQGFQTRWLLRVVGLPLVMAAFVVVIWVIQLCTVGRQKAAIGLKGNMFFCVFFTCKYSPIFSYDRYPSLTERLRLDCRPDYLHCQLCLLHLPSAHFNFVRTRGRR